MLGIAFLIPIVTCLILFFRYKRETVWWEYLVVLIPSILVSLGMYFGIRELKIHDTRVTAEFVMKIRHYDRWNEYIHRTCTEQVRVGTDKDGNGIYETRTYDCSYVEDHPEYYEMITGTGRKETVEKGVYEYYRRLWGSPETFINMHRDYYTIDGDAQEYGYTGEPEKALTLSKEESYRNYFKLQGNLYSISEDNKDYKDLPRYPKDGYQGTNGFWVYDQCPIIGLKASQETVRKLQYLNTLHHDFRVIIVGLQRTSDVARLKEYWGGGKDNEVVFCVGPDFLRSFSWSPEPRLENYVLLEAHDHKLQTIIDMAFRGYDLGYWVPRDFSEYSYITVDLSTGDYAWIFWITVILNVLVSVWVVGNEFKRGI